MLKQLKETHELQVGDLIHAQGYTMEILAITEIKEQWQPTTYELTVISNIDDNPKPYTREFPKFNCHTVILDMNGEGWVN